MGQYVRIVDDAKTAAVLAGSAGVLGAATVPLLLPAAFEFVPPDQRTLPLPLPLFCVLLAIQFLIIYGLFALAGLRLARARDREPAPLLTAIWTHKRPDHIMLPAGKAFGTGLLCGLGLVGAIALVKRVLPQALPEVLHPASFWGGAPCQWHGFFRGRNTVPTVLIKRSLAHTADLPQRRSNRSGWQLVGVWCVTRPCGGVHIWRSRQGPASLLGLDGIP